VPGSSPERRRWRIKRGADGAAVDRAQGDSSPLGYVKTTFGQILITFKHLQLLHLAV